MTRVIVLLALIASFSVACINKKEERSGAPPSSGGKVNDFVIPGSGNPDFAGVASNGGCSSFAACYTSCADEICMDDCIYAAPAGATDRFQAALTCGQSWCLDKNGTSASYYKCSISGDGTQLVELNGSPITDTSTCSVCLNNALADLFFVTCSNPTSVDCNPSACAPERSACLDD